MNLPEKLVIGGVPYEVEIVEGFIRENEDRFTLGEITYWQQRIQISDKMTPEYGGKILLHEAIHGILHEYGMDKYNKEDLVDRLTYALFDFIKNNDISFIAGEKPPQEEPGSTVQIGKAIAEKLTEEAKRPRQLPLGEDRNTFSLAEAAKIKTNEDKSHWDTGIKVKEGVKTYKTRYICSCGNRGRRYVSVDYPTATCHSCGAELPKKPATESGFPDRDGYGNFFFATDTEGQGT